jgi:hypothetical protein
MPAKYAPIANRKTAAMAGMKRRMAPRLKIRPSDAVD